MKTIALALGTLLLALCGAQAATYPIFGSWGYDNRPGAGPIDCTGRSVIAFAGNRRFETGGKVPPDYRNVSIERTGANTWRVTDMFFNGMQQGKVGYVLRTIDPDRIEMTHTMGGARFRLRRCN
jgi:hypothetical protein